MITVTLKNGEQYEFAYADGGGAFVGQPYEAHFFDEKDKLHAIFQKDIESVVDDDGNEVRDWGNPYMPGHRYSPAEVYEKDKHHG